MKKLISPLILTLALIGLLLPASASDPNFTVEPGWRVGRILFSMTKEEIFSIYGEGQVYVIPSSDNSPPMELIQYPNIGLDIVMKNGRIDSIVIQFPNYSIKDVVRIGTGIDRVKETMGEHFIQENYRHSYEPKIPDYKMRYKGITFHIKGERVVKITVTR